MVQFLLRAFLDIGDRRYSSLSFRLQRRKTIRQMRRIRFEMEQARQIVNGFHGDGCVRLLQQTQRFQRLPCVRATAYEQCANMLRRDALVSAAYGNWYKCTTFRTLHESYGGKNVAMGFRQQHRTRTLDVFERTRETRRIYRTRANRFVSRKEQFNVENVARYDVSFNCFEQLRFYRRSVDREIYRRQQ